MTTKKNGTEKIRAWVMILAGSVTLISVCLITVSAFHDKMDHEMDQDRSIESNTNMGVRNREDIDVEVSDGKKRMDILTDLKIGQGILMREAKVPEATIYKFENGKD